MKYVFSQHISDLLPSCHITLFMQIFKYFQCLTLNLFILYFVMLNDFGLSVGKYEHVTYDCIIYKYLISKKNIRYIWRTRVHI